MPLGSEEKRLRFHGLRAQVKRYEETAVINRGGFAVRFPVYVVKAEGRITITWSGSGGVRKQSARNFRRGIRQPLIKADECLTFLVGVADEGFANGDLSIL